MLNFLKVEIKSNASKATYLKLEEKKTLEKARFFKIVSDREEKNKEQEEDKALSDEFYSRYQNLRDKRRNDLRKTQRHMLLAYAFLRGYDYFEVEDDTKSYPNFDRVEKFVFNYMRDDLDPREIKQRLEEWVQNANDFIKDQIALRNEDKA